MSEGAQVAVALLLGTRDDADALRDAAAGDGTQIVYESALDDCAAADLLAAAPNVVLLNLPAALDEQSPLLEELAAVPGLRFVFNDASITSALEGWDRARWKRHLRAKLLDRPDDLPPRPESALTLRLPKVQARVDSARKPGLVLPASEQTVAAEMNSSLSQLADTGSGPPVRHDWSAELADENGTDVALDSAEIEGVGQEAMATLDIGDRIILDTDGSELDLNEDERALLNQMDESEADGEVAPPLPTPFDEDVRDSQYDQSINLPVHVDDLPANDQDGTLGEADEDLREFEEATSDDDTEAEKLDPPQGFAELSLAPIDEEGNAAASTAPIGHSVIADDNVTDAAEEEHGNGNGLRLESLDGNDAPRTGRASYLIDTVDRFQVDLRDGVSDPDAARTAASAAIPDAREVSVWALCGDAGSEGDMLEFLGALPPQLPVSFVVLQSSADAADGDALPLEPWRPGSGLAFEEALTFDCSDGLALDAAGRRVDAADKPAGVDGALAELSRHFSNHLGLILFAGSSDAGCEGLSQVHMAGGCLWSAVPAANRTPREVRAAELDAVGERGNPAALAGRLAAIHA